jgi:hypothetical protein
MEWPKGEEPGWHVILGDNGRGKSTLLRAASLVLLGPSAADVLRVPIQTWVREGAETAKVVANLRIEERVDPLKRPGPHRTIPEIQYKIPRSGGMTWTDAARKTFANTLWSQGTSGWFSVGFGPFRRFSGGAPEQTKLFYSHPRCGRHLSLHGEDVALTEIVGWLKELHYRRSVTPVPASEFDLLTAVQNFVNSKDILPEEVKLAEIHPDGVFFSTRSTARLSIESLSDGYRSILSMVLEILRQAVSTVVDPKSLFPSDGECPLQGVVMIDEVDVHLHPLWQVRVGETLTAIFPHLQFLVTTHSPLICQAARSLWKLEDDGPAVTLRPIVGTEFETVRNGSVQEVYGLTSVFGQVRERSPEGQRKRMERASASYSPEFLASLVSERQPRE